MIKSEKVAVLYDAEQIKEICQHCRANCWDRCSHCALAKQKELLRKIGRRR